MLDTSVVSRCCKVSKGFGSKDSEDSELVTAHDLEGVKAAAENAYGNTENMAEKWSLYRGPQGEN